jgi:hypothetical protein
MIGYRDFRYPVSLFQEFHSHLWLPGEIIAFDVDALQSLAVEALVARRLVGELGSMQCSRLTNFVIATPPR